MQMASGRLARLALRWCGALLSCALLAACAANGGARSGPFPRFQEFEGYEVRQVTFAGDLRLPEDSLRLVALTRPTQCRILFLPICIPNTSIGRIRGELDLNTLAEDITRLHLYYRDHGYYGSRIVPSVDRIGEEQVAVRFAIAPGDQVILRELDIEGTEGVVPPEELEASLPLRVGEPFSRIGFLNSADTVRLALLRRGHAYAEVLRNYALDTIADVAEAQFVALPGPLTYVDTILVLGDDRLEESTVRRQLTFGEGDLLRMPELARSQRNLYALEMVNFASIELAPDSLQVDPDTTRATVVVRMVEAAQYLVDTSAGFGTIDCLRTNGRWVNRNFVGGGRRLEVSGSLSKIGTGDPVDAGFSDRVCARSGEETFTELVNYRLAADFQQPRLFNTENQLGLNLHSERFSELDIFLRESTGGLATLSRNLGSNMLLTTTGQVEYGRTIADPVILCVGFETCGEEDLEVLSNGRWSNSLAVAAVRDATQADGTTTRGYLLRGGVDWASNLLGSDNQYLRLVVEGSAHRTLRPGWAISGNLRVGRFLGATLGQDEGYIPPELRFYAGGPNSVRGYARNALGPIAYVQRRPPDDDPSAEPRIDRAATGGTQLVVSSVELRGPSPFASDLLRLAAFVDAGYVTVPGQGLGTESVRFTPGGGIRFITPVGPIRLDIAYNGYPPEAGPLYLLDERGLIRVDDAHRPPTPPAFSWDRFQVHFAVGQAF